MSPGLSEYRIGNIAKTVTSLNLSKDAKKLLKRTIEEEMVTQVKQMEQKVLATDPETKTLLDLDSPQLSLNRVKGIMSDHTELKASSEAAITLKAKAEARVRQLTQVGESKAMGENMRTIKARHLPIASGPAEEDSEDADGETAEGIQCPEPVSDVGYSGMLPLGLDSIRLLIKEETGMKADQEACVEMREFVLDELDTCVIRMEERLSSRDKQAISDEFESIKAVVALSKLRRMAKEAGRLASERDRKSIGMEEIADSFDSI